MQSGIGQHANGRGAGTAIRREGVQRLARLSAAGEWSDTDTDAEEALRSRLRGGGCLVSDWVSCAAACDAMMVCLRGGGGEGELGSG